MRCCEFKLNPSREVLQHGQERQRHQLRCVEAMLCGPPCDMICTVWLLPHAESLVPIQRAPGSNNKTPKPAEQTDLQDAGLPQPECREPCADGRPGVDLSEG